MKSTACSGISFRDEEEEEEELPPPWRSAMALQATEGGGVLGRAENTSGVSSEFCGECINSTESSPSQLTDRSICQTSVFDGFLCFYVFFTVHLVWWNPSESEVASLW